MRKISKIIVHCSASDDPTQDDIKEVEFLHTAPKELKIKWGKYETHGKEIRRVGYHFFIRKNGELQKGRSVSIPGAHCKGHNNDSIGVCFSGESGLPTRRQWQTWVMLKEVLKGIFGLSDDDIYPHNHFNKHKTCPNFKLS